MKKSNIIIIICIFLSFLSCNKPSQAEISDLDKIKQSNKNTYPSIKMDSVQAINSITKQKVQELLDLSAIYASGNKNTGVDSLIYDQISSYFFTPDSLRIKSLINELDSLRVRSIKVRHLDINQEIKNKDTIDTAHFTIEYFTNNKKSLGYFDKKATYILKKSPVKFVKEFKFYFIDFDVKEVNSKGVTK